MLEEAYELHRNGRLAEAEARYREWLAFNPEDPDGVHLLAVVRRQRGAIGEAMQLARQAVALRPDRATFYVTLAGIEFHARQWAAARADFETALRLDPNQTSAYSALGHIARIQGDDARAEENFKRALLTDRERPDVLIGYGNMLSDRGDFAAALQYLSKAVQLDANNSATQASFGRALLGNGQWAFAETALENALRLRPDSPAALRMLLRARRGRGDLAAAEQTLERLAALPDQQVVVASERAELARARGDVEGEIAAWRRLDELQPESDAIHRVVALLQATQRSEAAVGVYVDRLAQRPDDVGVLRGLSALRVRQGDEASALSLMRHAREVAPDNPEVLAALASLLDRSGAYEEAATLAQRVLELSPGQPSAAGLLINGALLRGDADRASELAARIDPAALAPAQRAAWAGLSGCAAHLQGEASRAVEFWLAGHAARAPAAPPPLPAVRREELGHVGAGELAPVPLVDRVPAAILLGTPGSSAELIAALLTDNGFLVLTDRFPGDGRMDGFSKLEGDRYNAGISDTDARLFARQYSRAMARLPIAQEARVIEWLPAWDARLVVPLRAAFGAVPVILATDDPREALLNWLAFGTRAGWRLPDPVEGARWIAVALEHLIATAQFSGLPTLALNSTELRDDAEDCGRRLGEVLGVAALMPGERFAIESRPPRTFAARFPPGEWRNYAESLAPAFSAFEDLARGLREPSA